VVPADEALQLGLVDRVAPAAELAQAAQQWSQDLASQPTVALGYMKRNLNLALRASLSDVLDAEAVHMVRTFDTEDHKSAAAAFVDKRKPHFNGR
jgi:2-(1,2-epoxy-1,2-dihydrophenyl)acetyl-CoA isomerase